MSSFLPEQPIQVFPSVAATLGLEQATLLSALQRLYAQSVLQPRSGFNWVEVSADVLLKQLPFWDENDIRRLCLGLHEVGILLMSGRPFSAGEQFVFAFNEMMLSQPAVAPAPVMQANNAYVSQKNISTEWQPSKDSYRQMAQLGIPASFAQQQIPQFVAYWRDRNESRHSWDSKFIQDVLHKWRREESRIQQENKDHIMNDSWRPSPEVFHILTKQAGVHPNFIEDAIPEFVLYWKDRGERSSTWNSKFIQHVRSQWHRFNTLQENTELSVMNNNWRPNTIVYDVLRMANINKEFADAQLAEFRLYWQENGTPYGSWSTKFLQHVKRQWAQERKQQVQSHEQGFNNNGEIRGKRLVEDVQNRDWAY